MKSVLFAVLLFQGATGQEALLNQNLQAELLPLDLRTPNLLIRQQCATACGRLVKVGWRGNIDAAGCTECTCSFAGAFIDCASRLKCLSRSQECLEEGDSCVGRENDCPTGTSCIRGSCMQDASSACRKVRCPRRSTCTIAAFGTAICKLGCTTTCGDFVPHGWSGKDDGSNHCNTCWCNDGSMACTLVGCPPRKCPADCTPYSPTLKCLKSLPLSEMTSLDVSMKLQPAFTFRRMCYNAGTCSCGFYSQVHCFVNPCSIHSCDEGYSCTPNYCGGCYYQCVKDKCPARIRKPYSSLSCAERKLYVRAVKKFKQDKPTEHNYFVSMHLQQGAYAHSTSAFLPWHRWYLIGWENALRALGGEFECITIPYWDWEKDAGSEDTSPPLRCDTFGTADGIAPGTNCVTNGIAKAPWTASNGACLSRTFAGSWGFTGEASLTATISGQSGFQNFRPTLEGGPHGAPHVYVGGQMGTFSSPEDPLFMVHHCNVDRIWALWQDYHGYDEVAKASYTNTHYYPQGKSGVPVSTVQLNSVMPYDYNNAGDVMSYFSQPVTVRDMMHIHDMPYGQSYTYGVDSMAFTLGSPVSGTWDWVTPGTEPTVSCWHICALKDLDIIFRQPLLPRVWFQNAALPLDKNFQRELSKTQGSDGVQSREVLNGLLRATARTECDLLANKPTASPEWIKTMWEGDPKFFQRCIMLQ